MSSTSLKGLVGILVAAVALMTASAILAALPGIAEAQQQGAQDPAAASGGSDQNTTTTDNATGAYGARRPASQTSTTPLLVVEPSDSLWSISEKRLGPGAPPEQVAYEARRLFELNRERIGEDPNLLFPGQELALAPPAPEGTQQPAPDSPGGYEVPTVPTAEAAPVQEQRAIEPMAAPTEGAPDSPAAEDALSVEAVPPGPPESNPTDEQDESVPAESTPQESTPQESAPATSVVGGTVDSLVQAYDDFKAERRLVGLGIVALTLIVAALMARTLPMRRDVEDLATRGVPQGYHENHALPEAPTETPPQTAEGSDDEPSGPGSGPTPEKEADREPTSSPAGEAEGVDAAAPAFARGQEDLGQEERLRRIRRLRSIHQRRSPSSR
jgi:hypothetical protein